MEPIFKSAAGKRPLSHESDYSKCVICQTAAGDKGPLYKLTKRGLATFKNAVKIRNDDVYCSVWEDL